MRQHVRQLAIVMLALSLAACASQQSGTETAVRTNDRNVITREQMMERNFLNAYEAVEALKSTWMQTRGPDSFNTPSQVWVYIDNVRLGGVETLRTVSTSNISRIAHLSANDATARYGVGHAAGVIEIITLPGSAAPHTTP